MAEPHILRRVLPGLGESVDVQISNEIYGSKHFALERRFNISPSQLKRCCRHPVMCVKSDLLFTASYSVMAFE